MKKIFKLIACIFAIIWLLAVIVTIIEPYYFKTVRDAISFTKDSRDELRDMVEKYYWNVDDIKFLKWETILNEWHKVKIDNHKLYKLEYIDWDSEKWWIDVVCYNPNFSSILSLPQYALFEMLKFNKNSCYYIWSTVYTNEWECEYIPTQRFAYAWMYPYSLLQDMWEIQVKISEVRQ
jgi:hypothetical protein